MRENIIVTVDIEIQQSASHLEGFKAALKLYRGYAVGSRNISESAGLPSGVRVLVLER